MFLHAARIVLRRKIRCRKLYQPTVLSMPAPDTVTKAASHPAHPAAREHGRTPLDELLALYKGLVEVSTLINAITDYNELLTAIMEVARRVMRAEGSALLLLNEQTNNLELVVARSADGEVQVAHQIVPRDASVAGWVFEHGVSALVPDAYADPRFFRGVDLKTGVRTRSILCVPLPRAQGEHRIGVLQVLNALGEDRTAFTSVDQEALEAFANLAATAIDKLRYVEEKEHRTRFERELIIATEIQRSFLPASLPERPDLSFAARYRPAWDVGGDFYDLFEIGPDEIYFVVGDVAGKGIPAALLMAQSLSVLRLIIVPDIAPAQALARWNATLCRRSLRGLFVTAVLGRIVPSKRTVEVASAGHQAPWLVRSGESIRLEVTEQTINAGLPLAIRPTAQYEGTTFSLQPGESLLCYTDGLTDGLQPDTGTRLGEDGARRLLEKGFASPAFIVETLVVGEAAHRGETPPQDDLTLLAFGFRE